jgi:predicted glycosyltransferase
MEKERRAIWIDFENSPHVPFFYPIINELEARGYPLVITARDCYQVCGMADLYKINCSVMGKHLGKNKIMKILGTLSRTVQLLVYAKKRKPSIALSMGSRSQLVAASILRLPYIAITDYEHAQRLFFSKPTIWLIPEVLNTPDSWFHESKVIPYPGIKEDVYVPYFKPDPTLLRDLQIRESDILVTIRPPATEAHYHNPESEILFAKAVDYLSAKPDLQMVILPRSENQREWIQQKWPWLCQTGKILIPAAVVDGLNLIWHSDLVISGGGTMNREAAALKVPVYSIFRGKMGAIDDYLSKDGRLIMIESIDDVEEKIILRKRCLSSFENGNRENRALNTILGVITDRLQEDLRK